MSIIYNLVLSLISVLIKLIAPFNQKLKLAINGRRYTFSILKDKIKQSDRAIWFHCASLGEFEQGRPVIEQLKKLYPTHKIVLSFFSPSGYEVRKNYDVADAIVYLPIDTKNDVQKFIELVHPEVAIFVKYEFWPNLLNQLISKKIPTLLISGIFRDNQLFFKSYGSWMRNRLNAFTHFFVQDAHSKNLLNSVGFENVTLSGDTRFDRVAEIVIQQNELDFLKEFKNNKYTLVAGSTWPDDEKLLINYINNHSTSQDKFVIAPHNINQEAIQKLKSELKVKTSIYSNYQLEELKDSQVFIIDTVGILTKVYSYADVAYVGGGFTNGIHNVLEPATFGIPVVIGPKYQKFKEATDLVNLNACFSVKNKIDFENKLQTIRNVNLRTEMGQNADFYIKSNVGATPKIVHFLTKIIEN